MAQVYKIKFEDTLRRISVPDAEGISFNDLEMKVRDLFQIPSASRAILTYTDAEDDVITMADDQDLQDACLTQKLNPLKLEVKAIPSQTGIEAKGNEFQPNTTEFNVEALLKGLFPESTTKEIDQVLSHYPPCLFTTVPAHVLPKALDTFLGTLAAGSRDSTTKLQRGDRAIAPGVAVHKYIECDHCFMCPIVGPRYKSTKKHDYDLCLDCFNKVGNVTDYRKLDRPVIAASLNPPVFFQAENHRSSISPVNIRRPSGTVSLSGFKDVKGANRTLDAEFVMDVTILDGSKVEVGTSFTKSWRFKNSGMLPWPQHTRLVHIGGPTLGSTGVVTLKLPAGGLPCAGEFDVPVELKAPESSGMYLANWCLMAPTGEKFGHSVWVLIEAVPVRNDNQSRSKESHMSEEPTESSDEEAEVSGSGPREELTGSEEGDKADSLLGKVGDKIAFMQSNSDEQSAETDGFSLVERVDEDFIEESEPLTATEEFEMVGPPAQELASGDSCSKRNDANIEAPQNISFEDDSLASTGWDHMLKELEELGFCDPQTNIKELLLKSEGSIRRAVKELVELEKQMSGKIKAA